MDDTSTFRPRLRRAIDDCVIGGVCGGLARYFDIDPVAVRLGWVILTLMGFIGVPAYLLAWAIVPDETGQRATLPMFLIALFIVIPVLCGFTAASLAIAGALFEALSF